MTASLIVPERFCGPPNMGNGGYVSGLLAEIIGGVAEVTLRRATPLGRALAVERTAGGGAILRDAEAVLAEAAPAELAIDELPAVSLGEAENATRAFPRFVDHPVPRCFVCGIDREPGDGLRIFPGPVAGRSEIYAAPWIPDASLADSREMVRPEFLWAALDCAGAFAVNEPPRGLALLGRLAARIVRSVAVGETLVVAAWPITKEGRSLRPGTALYSAAGELVALGRATWILTKPT